MSDSISRRRLLAGSALAAAGAATASLAGACDAGPGGRRSGGRSVTLTVMYKANEFAREQIADFESRNRDIRIQFVEYDTTRLNAMLSSGRPPDLVRGAAFGSANTNARGLATNLDPYLEASSVLKKADLLPVNDSFRWDGRRSGQGPYYGICKDWSQDATLWYHKTLLDQAGVPAPSATEPIGYDQLMETARRLTVRQGGRTQVYGLGVEWAWNLFAPIAMMIMQQGGEVYGADLARTDMTTPAARRAVRWYVELAQSGVAPSSLDPVPDGADLSTFLAKRMAITQDGFWFGGNFVKESDEVRNAVRMAPAPVMGERRISPCYAGWGAYIPAKSRHKDEAWRLMEYFLAGEPAKERARSGWGLPALRSLLPLVPREQPYQREAYATSERELPYVAPLPDSPYVTVDSWNTVLDRHIQRAAKREVPVDAACQAITDDVNKLLGQGKEQID